MQSLEFGRHMHLVASFLMRYNKLDLDNACDRNNILDDWRFVAKSSMVLNP
jgi:hypothetical protein